MPPDLTPFGVRKIINRVALAWEKCVLSELGNDLRELPMRQRAVAHDYIRENCFRLANQSIPKYLENPQVVQTIELRLNQNPTFIMLHEIVATDKFVSKVVKRATYLMPTWRQGIDVRIRDLYKAVTKVENEEEAEEAGDKSIKLNG